MMKTLTFVVLLVMELSYAAWLISDYMDDAKWFWPAFLPAAVVCGISALFVRLYCRMKKVSDIKSVMKPGTVLVFGIELGAMMLYSIVEHWRWFM